MASPIRDLPYIPQCELLSEPDQAQSIQLQPPISGASTSTSTVIRSGGLSNLSDRIATPSDRTATPSDRTATPSDRTSTPNSSGGSRVRLCEEDKVKLVRLCILHQADHRYGNKKVFWTKIRELLKEEIGKELRDPQQAVNALVTQFEVLIKKEEKESGRYNMINIIKYIYKN